jgi:hypothetical protein
MIITYSKSHCHAVGPANAAVTLILGRFCWGTGHAERCVDWVSDCCCEVAGADAEARVTCIGVPGTNFSDE